MELQAPEGKGVFKDMDRWTEIRKKVLVEGVSKRQVMEEEGIHWETLKKILAHSKPPGYRKNRGSGPSRRLGRSWAASSKSSKTTSTPTRNSAIPPSASLSAYEAEDGYTGGYTQVKKAVRGLKRRNSEVFVPLTHRPGEARWTLGTPW